MLETLPPRNASPEEPSQPPECACNCGRVLRDDDAYLWAGEWWSLYCIDIEGVATKVHGGLANDGELADAEVILRANLKIVRKQRFALATKGKSELVKARLRVDDFEKRIAILKSQRDAAEGRVHRLAELAIQEQAKQALARVEAIVAAPPKEPDPPGNVLLFEKAVSP